MTTHAETKKYPYLEFEEGVYVIIGIPKTHYTIPRTLHTVLGLLYQHALLFCSL